MPQSSLRRTLTLGARVPAEVGLIIALTVAVSIGVAIGGRFGVPLKEWLAFVPGRVLHSGWVWQLFTSPFLQVDAISLLFSCLIVYWFGPDLIARWGGRRFLVTYVGLSAVASTLVCILAYTVWPALLAHPYTGAWPVVEALTIAWACYYPQREIRLYFVFPVSGRRFIYVTVGMTVLFAIMDQSGIEGFVPHFICEALALVYFFVVLPRQRAPRPATERERRLVRAPYLRPVPPSDDSRPPPKVWN